MDPGPGFFNLRDLGGYATTDGNRVRTGLLFRSNAPLDPGEDGRAFVAAKGIRGALDLREPDERERERVDLSGMDLSIREVPMIDGALRGATGPKELGNYLRQIFEQRGPRFAAAGAAMAEDDFLPGVIFCLNGKDRTGLMAAVVLDTLGVSYADIAADFQETERRLPADLRETMIQRVLALGLDREGAEACLGAPAPVMVGLLAWLRDEYGGSAGYLEHHGLPAGAIGTLRGALLE